MRIFEEFWWAAALSRMDIRDAQSDVLVHGVNQSFRTVPPEEVTTFNLVRRLAGRRRLSGGLSIALHSRPLEGGNQKTGRTASGADLELAVEVAPGTWVDLALQVKKFNPATGRYDGWKSAQNRNLITWARSNGRRSAGMLLYNSSDSPFVLPGREATVFNQCCSRTWCHGWRWPSWDLPDGRSPQAVSLVADVSDPLVSGLDDPEPADIAALALPWECLFCRAAQNVALQRATGAEPSWAEELLRSAQDNPDFAANSDATADVNEQRASFSLVLGMSNDERSEYEERGAG